MSRRSFLAGAAALRTALASGKGQEYQARVQRYPDPLTDREICRLTGPDHRCVHPDSFHHFAARNNESLIVAGEQAGRIQVFRLDLAASKLTQLTDGEEVEARSACLSPDEKSIFFLQGGVLKQLALSTLREREICSVSGGWRAPGDLNISTGGRYAAVVEMRQEDRVGETDPGRRFQLQFDRMPLCRIRIVEIRSGKNWVAAEEKAWLARPQFRPKQEQLLFCHEGPWESVTSRLWLVNLDGTQKRDLRPRRGAEELGGEYWTGDGRNIGYVHYPDHSGRKATVRALNPESEAEATLASCTQFRTLMGNADNSAIVGGSLNRAAPNLYVVFPANQREWTICQHGSSGRSYRVDKAQASAVSTPRPAFSPDSQWIYFTSDRDGFPAVYRATVADLVEKT